MLIWIWVAVAVGAITLWLRKRYSYFKDRGVNNAPVVPFVGNMGKTFTKQEHVTESMTRTYTMFPKDRFVGSFEFITPVVVLREPELLRLIGVKDFDSFADRRFISSSNDPVFSKSLIGLKGQKWREMRSTLSPAFTGSKLRNMVPLISECNRDILESLQKQIKENSGGYLDVDTHDLLTRYANDVIATCAFGIKSNSIKERDNLFFKMGTKITNFSFLQVIKLFLSANFPLINKIFTVNIFPNDAVRFLRKVVLSAMKDREDANLFRPDMIQLLIEAKRGTLKHEKINDEKDGGFSTVEESTIGKSVIKQQWVDDDLVAQAILFFLAGFNTVSTCLKFLLLELAINPDVQDKLLQEIEEHHKTNEGKIKYDKINQMEYLDMVICETLRKWPPGVRTDRQCLKTYNLGKPNEKSETDFIMEKGCVLLIPIWAIHHDPKYFPNPQKFDPERFSNENKHNIKHFTYLPFGIGPRNCIGSRFALIEVKVLVFELLRRFEVSPAPQTLLPPRFDRKQFAGKLEGGHWLRFKCRT